MGGRTLSRGLRGSHTHLSIERLEDRCMLAAYTLTDLGTLGGGSTAFAYDINDAGQVVGYATTAALQYHAFLWDDGVMTDLGTLATGSLSKAFGLNNNGQVVGYAAASGNNHAFLWDNGVMTDLAPFPEWSSSYAVNDAGQVVGAYDLNQAFLWEDGVLTELGGFGGSSSFGYAQDINNAGQVVGSSYVDNGSEGFSQHAFLWEEGVMTDLGALPGLPDSRAHAINELGQAVGFSTFFDPDTTDEIYESVLWSDGEIIDLGVPGGGNVANDINDSGQIVGRMFGGGYIYEDGVVSNLNDLIEPGTGLTLQVATGINNAGQIVGYSTSGGSYHAILLTPTDDTTPPELPGDYNLNGIVDLADYTVWRDTLDQTGLVPYSGADGDGDGEITTADLDVWKLHFGDTVSSGAGSTALALAVTAADDAEDALAEQTVPVEPFDPLSAAPRVVSSFVEPVQPADDRRTFHFWDQLASDQLSTTLAGREVFFRAADGQRDSSGRDAAWEQWAAPRAADAPHGQAATRDRDDRRGHDCVDAAWADEYFASDGAQADDVAFAFHSLTDTVFGRRSAAQGGRSFHR